MRKAFAIFMVSALFSAVAFGQAFVPQTLKLNPNHAERSVLKFSQAQYDAGSYAMPVELQGASSKAVLMVYTSNKAADIADIRNGFIGWHYVNKVDTCVYVSGEKALEPGDNTIVWDFINKIGDKVSKDEIFNYYLFAFEHNTPKVPVMKRQLSGTTMGVYTTSYLDPMGPGGVMRPAPIILYHSRRWIVGGDPNDATNYKTTSDNQGCKYALDINDDSYMYRPANNTATGATMSLRVTKWQFVENGTSVVQSTWGPNGQGFAETMLGFWGTAGSGTMENAGCQRDANCLYVGGNQRSGSTVKYYMLGFDGTELKNWDLGDIYIRAAGPKNGLYLCGGPVQQTLVDPFGHTKVLLNHHGFCWRVMVDPTAGYDNNSDFRTWINGNGDFFTDHLMLNPADSLYMECNTVNDAPYCYQLTADPNGVAVILTNIGGSTFGLMGPDGTGAGMHALYNEGAYTKYAAQFYAYGTQWDGLYCDSNSTDHGTADDPSGAFYSPANSFKGTLEFGVGVKEKAPAGFAVAQNSPNPFNPTTDITFTIPNRGLVTVDIFNVAGQKVTSIKNTYSQAGTYKVTWNASSMSTGIYFYTVTQGKFSKTMRMTLAK